jgi:glutathione-independent formaldehyde dehydrogenase
MQVVIMRAVVYNGPKDVSVDEVPDATIEAATDAIVKITATNICGSDLHMYEGRTSLEPGKVIGHENLGEVIEAGPGVVSVKVGDRVCLPFNIGCGFCKNCERGLTGFCLTVNPPNAGGAYGYCATSSITTGPSRRCWCRTTAVSRRRPMRIGTSMTATRVGRRSC